MVQKNYVIVLCQYRKCKYENVKYRLSPALVSVVVHLSQVCCNKAECGLGGIQVMFLTAGMSPSGI
jgi:hypothetical protein